MRRLLVATLMAATLVVCPAWATTIRVPGDQPTIQAGIGASSAGDTVLVACGTYHEHDIEMKPGVALASETGEADCVTIDAQQQGRVLYCDNVGESASVVGFTVTGGLASSAYPYDRGGGMYCYYSSPVIANCRFVLNECGVNGGAIYCYYSSPRVTNCVLSGNVASNGGGMGCFQFSSPVVESCAFLANETEWGGGLYAGSHSSPVLIGCTLSHNTGDDHGGALVCGDASSLALTDCVVAFSATGEGLYCDGTSDATVSCCNVYGNASGNYGGSIADPTGINGNFSADPMFCDPDNGNFMLDVMSPCAPDNNDCGVLIGAYPVGCGASPVEATSWGRVKAMYR